MVGSGIGGVYCKCMTLKGGFFLLTVLGLRFKCYNIEGITRFIYSVDPRSKTPANNHLKEIMDSIGKDMLDNFGNDDMDIDDDEVPPPPPAVHASSEVCVCITSVCLSVGGSVCLSGCLFVCLFVCMFVCMFVCLSV